MCGLSWSERANCTRICVKLGRKGMSPGKAKGATKRMMLDPGRNVPRDLFPLPVREIGLDRSGKGKSRGSVCRRVKELRLQEEEVRIARALNELAGCPAPPGLQPQSISLGQRAVLNHV
eukprot:6469412-Amphidinium_carterae.2